MIHCLMIGDFRGRFGLMSFEHRHDLLMKLARDRKTDGFSVIDELIVQKKLKKF